jgi:hypothetical protein
MDHLGAKQKNTVWSWCAVNYDEKKVYFSVWVDKRGKHDGVRTSYVIQEPHWGIDGETGAISPARKDHDEKLALVFENSYEAYGYFIEARNPNASPREIESIQTSFIFLFKLERQPDGTVLGYPVTRIEIR